MSGYYEVENLALPSVYSLYIYKGVPCLQCQYTCMSCTNSAACIDCNSTMNREVNSSSGFCSCMAGFYDDGFNQLCIACHYSCLSCNPSTTCLSCPATRTQTGTSCPCDATYFDAGVATCQSCLYSCATCDNNTNCASCNTTYFRTMNTSTFICDCIVGYYDINGVHTCGTCHVTCFSCIGGNNNNCTACSSSNGRELTSS